MSNFGNGTIGSKLSDAFACCIHKYIFKLTQNATFWCPELSTHNTRTSEFLRLFSSLLALTKTVLGFSARSKETSVTCRINGWYICRISCCFDHAPRFHFQMPGLRYAHAHSHSRLLASQFKYLALAVIHSRVSREYVHIGSPFSGLGWDSNSMMSIKQSSGVAVSPCSWLNR